jgi:hypothetical protein
MKELLKRFIPDKPPEEKKSEAQNQTEIRAEKYTEFFKKPLDYLQSNDKPKLGMAYKAIAGVFINSAKLDSTRSKQSFKEKLQERKGLRKAFFVFTTGTKIIAKTTLSSVQFVIRNSIKQPSMLLFRTGAGVNNLIKYTTAKRNKNNTRTEAELANLKYQAKETLNALIGTAVTASIIISTLGSAGITASFFGAATTAIVTTASAVDTAAIAKDTAEGIYKQTKGRKQPIAPSQEQEIELPTIKIQKTLAKLSSQNSTTCNSSLPNNTSQDTRRHQ